MSKANEKDKAFDSRLFYAARWSERRTLMLTKKRDRRRMSSGWFESKISSYCVRDMADFPPFASHISSTFFFLSPWVSFIQPRLYKAGVGAGMNWNVIPLLCDSWFLLERKKNLFTFLENSNHVAGKAMYNLSFIVYLFDSHTNHPMTQYLGGSLSSGMVRQLKHSWRINAFIFTFAIWVTLLARTLANQPCLGIYERISEVCSCIHNKIIFGICAGEMMAKSKYLISSCR